MSVYKRSRGRWAAVVYEPATGKRRWLGTFDSKRDAQDAEDNAKRRTRHGGRFETIESFAARWMDDYPRRKESTTAHYRQQIKALSEEFGHLRLDQLDRAAAREWAQRCPSWPAARAMFSDAVRDELCDRNPFLNMRLQQSRGRRDLVVPTPGEIGTLEEMEPPEDERTPLTLVQAAVKVHGAWGRRVYAPLIVFAAYTGARPGELHGLDWRHVDRRGRTLTIERQWNPKLRKMTATKNGRSRTVYLPPPALGALDALPDTGSALFTTPTGARMGGATSHYYWDPVRAAFGRMDLDFYSLRHAFGTYLAGLGVGAPDIAQAMGHTDGGKLALERYIHVTAQDSRARIAAAFGAEPARPVEVERLRKAGER